MNNKKTNYICFLTKNCKCSYEKRTRNPYVYYRKNKYTVTITKILPKYKNIILKNCRINDMLKYIKSDFRFPMNSTDYINLLIEVTEKSKLFYSSLKTMKPKNYGTNILRLACFPIKVNFRIIRTLLTNELEGTYLFSIRHLAENLKRNLIYCIRILTKKSTLKDDWVITHRVVEALESYVSCMKTVCSFIYLVILKMSSYTVFRLLPTIPYSRSQYFICSICNRDERICTCFVDLGESYQDDEDYSTPRVGGYPNNNREINESQPSCSSNVQAGIEAQYYWYRHYNCGSDTD